MKKNEKRTYLSPETEVVRFTADIITTSGDHVLEEIPDDKSQNNASYTEPGAGLY